VKGLPRWPEGCGDDPVGAIELDGPGGFDRVGGGGGGGDVGGLFVPEFDPGPEPNIEVLPKSGC